MKITIYGAGYVGLVTAVCFAEVGNSVLCVDIDTKRIAQLNAGECPIHEPGLLELLQKHLQDGRLKFTDSVVDGVSHGFYQFIAVGTPSDEDGSADLKYVLACAENIGNYLNEYRIVITKSTVPVGTADKVQQTIQTALRKRGLNIEFDVASNPEFLREGAAVSDFMNSDRIVVGTVNDQAAMHMRNLYSPFNRQQNRLITMDIRSAELTKYAANAMLATKISFINEMSQLAELFGADIEQIRIGIGSDPRIGPYFINPGCGYGGSCFPKDVSALNHMASSVNYQANLIRAVHDVNEKQKLVLFNKIKRHFGDLNNKIFALWGLSFKPDTDDMREASSRVLMEALWQEGAKVQAFDPVANKEANRIYGTRSDLKLCDNLEDALIDADALIILTEWKVFLSPDFNLLKQTLKNPIIFDGRNIYDPDYLQQLGFTYYAIGRGHQESGIS